MQKIIRIKEVSKRCSLSRSSIYAMAAKGIFPNKVSIGARAVGWVESDIDEWIANCVSVSKANASQKP
jgi:prophage regulatory protein